MSLGWRARMGVAAGLAERWALAALVAALAGCSGDDETEPTQVIVLVNAEEEVRAVTAEVHLLIRDGDGESALDDVVAPEWPVKLVLVPKGGDASRTYTVTAEAVDDAGSVRARARLASGYVEDERRFVVLLLESACLGVTCSREDQTCHAGRCALAAVKPDQFGTVQAEAPDVGMLLGISMPDGGTADAGGDGGEAGRGGAGGKAGASGKGGTGGKAGSDGHAGSDGQAGASGEGGSAAPDPCDEDNGGCDERVSCRADAAEVICGDCPDGFADESGDGTRCVDFDACAGGAVCTADFPCRDLPAPSTEYSCRGQYAEWKPSDSPAAFTTNTDGTVTDTRSALIWQETIDGGTYAWDAGKTYCERLTLAGSSDWRLPARAELESIIDFAHFDASIAPNVFPGTPGDWFWSSSPFVGDTANAWSVVFDSGNTFHTPKTRMSRVRCVRGADSAASSAGSGGAPPGRYAVRGDGTVDDLRTTLTWQRVPGSETYAQAAAVTYCQGLALAGGGWRLPAISELLSLVDPTRSPSAIDPIAFPGALTATFWSSTAHATVANEAWSLYFSEGYSMSIDTATAARVRCVR